MSEIDADLLERLKRLADAADRRDRLGDAANDDYFELMWERPHMLAALVTLCPKAGDSWTEERLLLWLEVVEKTARLVYGLRSEWEDIVNFSPTREKKGDAEADRLEADAEEPSDEPEPAPVGSDSSSSGEGPKEEPPELDLTEIDRQVLETLEQSPRVALRRKEIAERAGLNPHTVTDSLARLRTSRRVEKCGASSGTSYRLWIKPEERIERIRADAEARGKRVGPRHPVTVRHVDPATLRGEG